MSELSPVAGVVRGKIKRELVYKCYKTLADYHRCSAEIRLLGGPGGVGKTVAMLKDSQIRAQAQEPYYSYEYPAGIRHTKFLFTRRTRGEIKGAIINVMREWFNEQALTIWVQPDRAEYKYIDKDGITVLAEYEFLGLDDDEAMSKVDSLGWTEVYINEGHHMTEFQHSRLVFRGRRFPVKIHGVSWTNGGCTIDFNPPDLKHWIARLYVLDQLIGEGGEVLSEVFMVPPPVIRKKGKLEGGMYHNGWTYFRNPLDEASFLQDREKNGVKIPGYRFWLNKVPALSDRDIRSLVLGEFIPVRDGKPVYENYDETLHLAKSDIHHNPDRALDLAIDFGHNSACVLGQELDSGTYAFLDEVYVGDLGLISMLDQLAKILHKYYQGMYLDIVYDPSDRKLEGRNDVRQSVRVKRYLTKLGFRVKMTASKNEWESRRSSMQMLLDTPKALIISQRIQMVRASLMGEYCYPKKRAQGQFHPKPDKNDKFSHTMDCCEYLAQKVEKRLMRLSRNISQQPTKPRARRMRR